MNFSKQQDKAIQAVGDWFKNRTKEQQVFKLFGYAGTGKTTIAKHFTQFVDGSTRFAAFTGKASYVLMKKGCHPASTIHALIYRPEKHNGITRFVLNRGSPAMTEASLIIIDECSMVDETMGKDLLSFGKPILVLGDPEQLPPIDGAGFFTSTAPDVMLTDIHRQAEDNPIIRMATKVRLGEKLQLGNYGDSSVVNNISLKDAVEWDQVLAGRLITKDSVNQSMRRIKGFRSELPEVGERLMCSKNNHDIGIYNGGTFTVLEIHQNKKTPSIPTYLLKDDFGSDKVVNIHNGNFDPTDFPIPKAKKHAINKFEFGYALTCHKSQGSEWPSVILYNEAFCFRESAQKWLYTGITRAAEKIMVVNDK